MTDVNKQIINLIKENTSMKEMCRLLNISQKQLYVRIKQIIKYGYNLIPSYSYDSDIYYKIENNKEIKDNEISIKISNQEKEFRCIAISDAHIGNVKSDMKLLDIVYDYATKNGIHTILTCGDMLEGVHSSDNKNILDLYKQVEELIKKYPYDKNINNFGILGNHEYHFLHYDNIDIANWINDSRYDIVLFGYGDGLVRIKNDSILLHHHLSIVNNKDIQTDSKIILLGHGHMMKSKFYDELDLCIPTISYVSPDKTNDVVPGFVDMKISLEKNKFSYLEAHHMIITPKIYEASQTRCKIRNLVFDNSYKGK